MHAGGEGGGGGGGGDGEVATATVGFFGGVPHSAGSQEGEVGRGPAPFTGATGASA